MSIATGVKSLHVLAFTSQFAIMAHHIEMMLAQVTGMMNAEPVTDYSN